MQLKKTTVLRDSFDTCRILETRVDYVESEHDLTGKTITSDYLGFETVTEWERV